MRIFSACALLLIAGCDQTSLGATEAEGELIECALAGAGAFERHCRAERAREGADLVVVVVRHPDGGFRRFVLLPDGRGVATADGADVAQVSVQGGGIEVAVDADRYRLPATIAPSDDR